MRKITYKNVVQQCATILWCVLLLAGITGIQTNSASFEPVLSVRQEFIYNVSDGKPVNDVFYYKLQGVTGKEPLPQGAVGFYIFPIKGTTEVDLELAIGKTDDKDTALCFHQVGIYEYTLSQKVEARLTDYVYDGEEYHIRILIVNKNGKLKTGCIEVRDSGGGKSDAISFTNAYQHEESEDTSPVTSVQEIEVQKEPKTGDTWNVIFCLAAMLAAIGVFFILLRLRK